MNGIISKTKAYNTKDILSITSIVIIMKLLRVTAFFYVYYFNPKETALDQPKNFKKLASDALIVKTISGSFVQEELTVVSQ